MMNERGSHDDLSEPPVVLNLHHRSVAETPPRGQPPRIESNPTKTTVVGDVKVDDVDVGSLAVVSPEVDEAFVAATAPLESQPFTPVDPFVEVGRSERQGAVGAAAAKKFRWYRWPGWLVGRTLELVSLLVILSVVAAIPLVQLASLGYLLNSAANLAQRRPWSASFPGLQLAGRIGTFALLATLFWLPVWLVTDLSYSAQLLQPGSQSAFLWRVGAFAITFAWLAHVGWAAVRGGRWWHFLWPAPVKFLKSFWRPSVWNKASDDLYDLSHRFHFTRLWWLGLRAAIGALAWVSVPVSLMIIGQRADNFPPAVLIGITGAVSMTIVMLYLPFLQIQLASRKRFRAIFDVRAVRRRFLNAPIAHAISLMLLCLLCIPLYLLRIEATPAELLWAPSLVFVVFMLPAKLLLGAAMGYADGREERLGNAKRHWSLRWPARGLALASVLVYVGALYVAQLVAGQGAFVMYFQHAFLVPAPLISS